MADIICVDGDPSQDVTILGEPGRIRNVMVGGRMMDISRTFPSADAFPVGGLASMGSELTREIAFSGRGYNGPPLEIEELH